MTTTTLMRSDFLPLGVVESAAALPCQFTAEASDLQWGVGVWPERIVTDAGNGQDLIRSHFEVRDGDLCWVDYRQALGMLTLRVFND